MSPARVGVLGVLLASFTLTACGAFITIQERMERAQQDMKSGRWQEGAFELHAVLQKEPQNAQAWLLLAQLSLDAADPSGAQSALHHALGAGAKGPQVDLLRARTWLATGRPKALLDALAHDTIHLRDPDRAVMLGKALLASGKPEKAVAVVQPLIERQPSLTEARIVFAECLAQEGKLDQALTQLYTGENLEPSSPEPLLLMGRIDELLGHYSAADQSLKDALRRMPSSEPIMHRVMALIALSESRLALDKIDSAGRSQAILAKLAPLAPTTMLLDARVKLARKDLTGATSELERLVARAPDFMQARMVLGAALLEQGDLEQAQQQLQRVVERTPDNLQARKLLADVQLKLGQPSAALAVLTPALAAPDFGPQLLPLFIAVARRTGDSRALIEALNRSRRAHPHDQAVDLNLASVYLSTGHAAQALSLLDKTRGTGNVRRDKLLILALLAIHGPQAAGEEVDRLLAAHPHDAAVLDLAAWYCASQNQLEHARALLREALSLSPDDLTSLVELAQVEEAADDVAAARRRLSSALSIRPDVLPIRLALVDALLRTRSFGRARAVLLAAKDANSVPAVQFALARVALEEGDLTQANAALNRAIAARPGRAVLLEQAGALLMQANQYAAALNRFAQATSAAPDNALFWLERARAQLALNQPAAARSSLERAARLQPQWLPVVSTLALIDLRRGNGHAALSRVDALLEKRPMDPGALALKGDLETALHQPAAAVNAYTEAQRLRPSPTVAVKLYNARLAAHAPDPAQPLQQWLRRVPTDWRVRDVLAEYYLLVAHSPRQAVPELRAVLRLMPNDVVALNNLAWVLGRTGRAGARSLAERAYRLAPQSPQVNDTLGWILVRKGEGQGALAYLKRAVTLDPKDPEIEYHYAYALAKTGERTEARQILSRILSSGHPFESAPDARRLLTAITT